MKQYHLEHLQKISLHWKDVLSNLFFLNKMSSHEVMDDINPYIVKLSLLPVSKKSLFCDMLWDYDEETLNRAASIGKASVRLDFGLYAHIPLGVITEVKCLFLMIKASPRDFGHRKSEIKLNYLIDIFLAGLRFLDFVFSEVEKRLGRDYVQLAFNKISEIALSDFEEAANKTTLTINNNIDKAITFYKTFFDYLNSHAAKIKIGIECEADYEAIKKAYEKDRKSIGEVKNKKLPYLETNIFDLSLRKASFNVVSFLKAVDEKVSDPIMCKHYNTLATKYEKFSYSKQAYQDYGAYRMSQKGYPFDDINSTFPLNKVAKFDTSVQPTKSMVSKRFGKKYVSSEALRVAVNKIFYSALWVIGALMGARPNVYSGLKIDNCLDLENNSIVAVEHKGRDNRWNLFHDRWIAVPIMLDAMKVVELIGGKIFQNTYVFASVGTLKAGEVNKPSPSLSSTIQNSFVALTGIYPKDINSKLNGYVFRHSLAHQMYRADVGLPVISYQLKHIVSATNELARKGKVSQTTIGYGGIANLITSDKKGKSLDMRHIADLEAVKANFDPNGKYMGGKAEEHISSIKKFFNGCMEAGYSEDEIYEAMVKQGLAIINVGSGYCFGGVEDFDETLPCIGGLRCNPVRCHNAVVTKANAPKWREIYISNLKLIGVDGYENRQDQIVEAIEESKRVLEYLGEELI